MYVSCKYNFITLLFLNNLRTKPNTNRYILSNGQQERESYYLQLEKGTKKKTHFLKLYHMSVVVSTGCKVKINTNKCDCRNSILNFLHQME